MVETVAAHGRALISASVTLIPMNVGASARWASPRNPVRVVVAAMLFTMTLWLVHTLADRGLAHVGRLREGSGLAMS
ncbi:hypothetical protein OG545_09115 [Streptomyces europaeiscabiei]